MRWRSAAKTLLERALVQSGVPGAARRRRVTDVLILAYHNVVPLGESAVGERSLHISERDFGDQLDVIAETHEIIPLLAALDSLRERPSCPRAVLTFDDAYRGAITVGLAAAATRGLPATVFVAPAFIGGRSFWWDALADPRTGELEPSLRHRALWAQQGDESRVRAWAATSGREVQSLPQHATCAHDRELAHASTLAGVTFGSHSWSHCNLAALDDALLGAQLRDSHAWLRAAYPATAIPWISYPYGLSSARVEKLAAAEGFVGGLRIEGGWHRPGRDQPYALPRLNIPSALSRDGFVLRTSGILSG